MIVDASAIVALALLEPEWKELSARLEKSPRPSTHPLSVFEAALAIRRIKNTSTLDARAATDEFLVRAEVDIVPIGAAEIAAALEAFERYGKGRHPAGLNMGDCFSYACAKLRGMPLLYKGNDFARTDLA